MKETTKAMNRRAQESASGLFDWAKLFADKVVLDAGCGDDSLYDWFKRNNLDDLPRTPLVVIPFDTNDGGGDRTDRFFPGFKVDVIHGSQVLEHAKSPETMLQSWLAMLDPGGYIVATVPDWKLYEHCIWPSKTNAGHRTAWTLDDNSVKYDMGSHRMAFMRVLPDWLSQFPVEILRCKLIDANYNYSLGPEVDQTFDASKGTEAFIEVVCRKL